MRSSLIFILVFISGNHTFSQIDFSLIQKDSNSLFLNIQNSQKLTVFIKVSSFFNEFSTNELSNNAGLVRIDILKKDEYIDPQIRPFKTLEIKGGLEKSIVITGQKEDFLALMLEYYIIQNYRKLKFRYLVRKNKWRKIKNKYEMNLLYLPISPSLDSMDKN